MLRVLLCASLLLCEAFAQERHFGVGLTRNSQIEVMKSSGRVKVDLILTEIQFSVAGPQTHATLFTIYDQTSGLVWWMYLNGEKDPFWPSPQFVKDYFFFISADSIVLFNGRYLSVRECRLRAVSPQDALNKVVTEMDEHILDSRAGRLSLTSEPGKKEFYIRLNLRREDFSPDFFGHRLSAWKTNPDVVKVVHTGSKWLLDLKGYDSIATVELSDDFHKIAVLKQTPISSK